ncbi:Choline kinase alpha [Halotydeus destructor]|nr:Choline kinase alpha [Halotydeus destructor]
MAEAAETKLRRMSQIYNHEKDISKEEALEFCANFVGGSWENLSQGDFEMQVLRRGMINRIFVCENKCVDDGNLDEPKKVILRLYGGKVLHVDHIWRNGGVMEEVLVSHVMSYLKLGPRLLGVFPGGRLEQYLESRPFGHKDFLAPKMEALFARNLARMHAIKMPFAKKQRDVLDRAETMLPDWLERGKAELEALVLGSEYEQLKTTVLDFDLSKEFDWLRSLRPRIKSRQVLSHGDMNPANCLVVEKAASDCEKLILIDYEFSNYGPRGYDIGAHFYNRLMELIETKDGSISYLEYPTEDERRHFIRAYNDEMNNINAYDLDVSENGVDNEDNMLTEAEFWILGLTLFFRMIITANLRTTYERGDDKTFIGRVALRQKAYTGRRDNFIQIHLPLV